MFFIRRTVHSPVITAVLPATPVDRFVVKIGQFVEEPSREKVSLYELYEPFYSAFCKRMARFTELRLEADVAHKELIILLPYRLAVAVTVQNNAFHV